MTPRDDERRKFEAWQLRIGSYSTRFVRDENGDYENTQADLLWRGWLARAEQAEPPQTRKELEKEWLAQTEWQDFANWLIHVKLCGSTPAPTESSWQAETPRIASPIKACKVCRGAITLTEGDWRHIPLAFDHVAAPVEDSPAPTPTARQKVYAFMQLPTHVKLERLRDLAWELAAIPGRPKSAKPTLPIETICAKWTDDCQGKKDYDGRIVSISTRYWPSGGGFHILPADHQDFSLSTDPAIRPSAAASIHLNFGEPDEYGYGDYRELARAEFEADTEQEVKQKVEAWAAAQFKRIGSLLEGKL